ncbi:MAG: hypothetical protein IPK82_03945 [Polyangiaceae bacterium]|nr:hypothetical protein [Polyangiaceae bacterium]
MSMTSDYPAADEGPIPPEREANIQAEVEAIEAKLVVLDAAREVTKTDARALHRRLQNLVYTSFRAMVEGALATPSRVAQALEPLGWFVEKYLPIPDISLGGVARELASVIQTLRMARETTGIPQLRAQIRREGPLSIHGYVLRTLLDGALAQGPQRVADVQYALAQTGQKVHPPELVRPTLLDLVELRLVYQTQLVGVDGKTATHFGLSEAGTRLCNELGIRAAAAPHLARIFEGFTSHPTPAEPKRKKNNGPYHITSLLPVRGAAGTSLAAAHVGHLLSRRDPTLKLLMLDLDVVGKSLGRMLRSAAPSDRPGLFDILAQHIDHPFSQPEFNRRLSAAVVHFPGTNLSYLPPGNTPVEKVRWLIDADLLTTTSHPYLDTKSEETSFVLLLREFLQKNFKLTLVDCPPLLSEPQIAYWGSTILADVLALFLGPHDSDAQAIRSAYTAFVHKDPLQRSRSNDAFMPVLARQHLDNEDNVNKFYQAVFQEVVARRTYDRLIRLYEHPQLLRGRVLRDSLEGRTRNAMILGYEHLTDRLFNTTLRPTWSRMQHLLNEASKPDRSPEHREILMRALVNLSGELGPSIVQTFSSLSYSESSEPAQVSPSDGKKKPEERASEGSGSSAWLMPLLLEKIFPSLASNNDVRNHPAAKSNDARESMN